MKLVNFRDYRLRDFAARIDDRGRMEIGDCRHEEAFLVLDDEAAAVLEGLCRSYRLGRTLSDETPAPPSRDALMAAIEDLAAKIDRMASAVADHDVRIDWLSSRMTSAELSLSRRLLGL